jgi:DNA invertase Pin-like site-specific DNA recombinase
MSRTLPLVPSKITADHLRRDAIVYVRQSSLRQVENHQESTRLQYQLAQTVEKWGWAAQQIDVIDEDLGKTASEAEARGGFQRMMAEISKERIGLIIGLDVSRLARSSADWHRLLKLCELFDTLVADVDGVYDLSKFNDRLLLGLKGTMSEAELYMICQRLLAGQRHKAERGELLYQLPVGYVLDEDGQVIKEPDEQGQAVISLCFNLFNRLGTINGVLRHLVEHNIELPYRRRSPPGKGKLEWRPATRSVIRSMMINPFYAGAYVYGRRGVDRKKRISGRPSTGRMFLPREEWMVFIEDHHPAYLDLEAYERNQQTIEANQVAHKGTIRPGQAILVGLVRCARCGSRMTVSYSKRSWRYVCSRNRQQWGGPACQAMDYKPLNELVSGLVLKALEPVSLELSLSLLDGLDEERNQLISLWGKKLERAAYEVQRAFRQYDAVEPENRLVARTLEKRWEETLLAEEQLRREHHQAMMALAQPLSQQEREEIRALATDLPALWHAETTTVEERQALVRIMIDEVIVLIDGEEVAVEIKWSGGDETQTVIRRPVSRWGQIKNYEEIASYVERLRGEGLSCAEIAEKLNAKGWMPPKRDHFDADAVRRLIRRIGAWPSHPQIELKENEWTASQLARKLGFDKTTISSWARQGKLRARLEYIKGQKLWIIHATEQEIEQIRDNRR